MTTKPTSPRSELVRKRRTEQKRPTQTPRRTIASATRPAFHPQTVYLPVEPRRTSQKPIRSTAGKKQSHGTFVKGKGARRILQDRPTRRSYDVAFSLGRTDVHAPALALPQLGPRWISAGLTLLLGFMLYTLWTASTFKVSAAEVSGNERLTVEDITGGLGVAGQPIFKAVPAQIAESLRTTFPDLESVQVHVSFPNRVSVRLLERYPVLAWYQDGKTTWIDSKGVAFTPRGEVKGLIQVASISSPTGLTVDPTKSIHDQVFIQPDMVKAIIALSPYVPEGISMTYDPQYGMGWQDPRGWSVYFGQNTNDIPMKLNIYQSIVDTFIRQGIQPTVISVEYLDAPFYK
jgi:cell division protein FtsQ